MKRLHLQRRVGKSELGELRSLRPWCMGVALLLSLLLSVQVGSIHSQEQPGTRRARPNTPAPPVPKPQEPTADYRYNTQDRRDPLEPLERKHRLMCCVPSHARLNDRLGLSNASIFLP
jgi:hypothetical protein